MSAEPNQFRLLLVEDEPTQRMMCARQLQRAGYIVETASDGNEALEKIAGGRFQILVTDWEMPGIDGATLCRRVREAQLPTYLYILLLTGHSSTADVVAGLEAGADDYVKKPAEEAELIARLSAGRRIIQLEQAMREANARIQMLSITDPLLGTFNRRYLSEHLCAAVEHARRYTRPLSVVMADLDRFKHVNDTYGHQVGDEVLKHFAGVVMTTIRRASDWVARYGGEEFVIVLPETDSAGAAATAEKIRAACAGTPLQVATGELSVTASFGVASLKEGDEAANAAAETMLREADTALYRSKREGRDRVTIA